MRERLQQLARQAGPHAARDFLQGPFAVDAEALLTALERLAWRSSVTDLCTIRVDQMLDSCAERLAYLKQLRPDASDGYVAYTARRLARELDMAFYLLNPLAHDRIDEPVQLMKRSPQAGIERLMPTDTRSHAPRPTNHDVAREGDTPAR